MRLPAIPRTVTAVVALLCAVLLTACNGGVASESGPRPTATFGDAVKTRLAEDNRRAPTRTPTPQSQSPEPTPTSTPLPATPTPRPEVSPDLIPDEETEALFAALLTEDEMPAGWTRVGATTTDGIEQGISGDDGMLVSPDTPDDCGAGGEDPYLNQTTALFRNDADDLVVLQNVSLYASGQTAGLMLAELFASLERCPEYEEVYGDTVVLNTVQPLEYPPLGDQSGAFLITSTVEGYYPETVVVVVFRIDRTVAIVLQTSIAETSGPYEAWDTQDIVLRAHEKLHAVRERIDQLERPPVEVI